MVAQRWSFTALFPASESSSRTRILLPCQRCLPLRKVDRDGLAFELGRCGASPFGGGGLGGPVLDRKRRGPRFPLQTVCVSRPTGGAAGTKLSCGSVFLRKVAGLVCGSGG